MSILNEIETLKYHFVLDLIKKDEVFNQKKAIVNCDEVLKKCFNRYLIMQNDFFKLKSKLGDDVKILSILFSNSQDENGITIRYLNGEKQHLLSISQIDLGDFEIVSTDQNVEDQLLLYENRKIIFDFFNAIYDNSYGEKIIINSTSGKFIVTDNGDSLSISDSEKKIFSIEGKYSDYQNNHSSFNILKLECNYPKLKELLQNQENVQLICNHLHFYEDMLPNELTKKLVNR